VINIVTENLNTSIVRNFSTTLINTVKALQECRFTTSRRTDQSSDLVRRNIEGKILQALEVSIPEAEFIGVNNVFSI